MVEVSVDRSVFELRQVSYGKKKTAVGSRSAASLAKIFSRQNDRHLICFHA